MKPQIILPPLARLEEMFILDPGIPNGLRWKSKAARNTVINSPAGRRSVYGYWEVRLDKILYRSSRIVYKMYNEGQDPIGYEVDHLDRNKDNNSGGNLVLATKSHQQTNRNVRNESGYRNSSFDKRPHRHAAPWMSHIKLIVSGKKTTRFLGYFANPYEASLTAVIYKRANGMRWEFAPGGTK